jgi:hypothetical protein
MQQQQLAEAQQVLRELFTEGLLPFELSAETLVSIAPDEYVIRFYDTRLRSVDLSWCEGESFREAFRVAVLERVKRLSGPLYGQAASDQTVSK